MIRSRTFLALGVVFVLVASGQLVGTGSATAAEEEPASFIDTKAGLTGVVNSSSAWGDYDSDGDLDVLISGCTVPDCSSHTSKIYENVGGVFSEDTAAGLTGIYKGSIAWGDYDSDGDLDILIAGCSAGTSDYCTGRTSKIYRNDAGTFTDIAAGLPGVSESSVAWGDYDSDGDLDILLTGSGSTARVSKIYENVGGVFSEDTAADGSLPGVSKSSVAWGDYDSDGDLDILLTGYGDYGAPVGKIYENDDGIFAETAAGDGLDSVSGGSVAWGDYDSDGDLDILLTGFGSGGVVAKIYENRGLDGFRDIGAGLPGVIWSSAAWGDYDSDGDLDILLTGCVDVGCATRVSAIYRNDDSSFREDTEAGSILARVGRSSAAWGDYNSSGNLDILLTGSAGSNLVAAIYRNENEKKNDPPTAPVDLDSSFSDGQVAALSWKDTGDEQTESAALTYNLRVGTKSGGYDVVSPMVAPDGSRLLPQMGNVQQGTTAVLRNLPPGDDYVWSVQAIDNNFAGSAFSDEGKFSVDTPSFAFSSTSYSASEGAGSATITIERLGSTAGSDAVNFSTTGGTATADSDYTAITDQVVSFSPGEASTTVSVPILEDAASEVDETVLLSLSGAALGSPSSATLTIEDNDVRDIGADLTGAAWGSAAWGDYDSDGDLDILLSGVTGSDDISKIYRNDDGIFTDIGAGLTGVSPSSVAWGDYDSDGDLDILLSGSSNSSRVSKVYRNDGSGSFTDIGAGLTGVSPSSVAWGDYDSDGDLDILLSGNSDSGYVTKIYRNDGSSGFTDIGAGLTGVSPSSVAWGDHDSDGDLDILLSGVTGSGYVSKIYQNNAGSFTEVSADLTGVGYSSVAWGDYDSDGDLDVLLAGLASGSGRVSKVYRNDGGGDFTDIGADLTGVTQGSTTWGDYDSDGDLDILLSGNSDPGPVSKIYRNDDGIFTDIGAGLIGVYVGSTAWGDYDSDGDLDILLSGNSDSGYVSKIYRNQNDVANTPPSAPNALAQGVSGSRATLVWTVADDTDTETEEAALTYNLRVGTTPGGTDVASPMAFTGEAPNGNPNGTRLLPKMGNAGERTSYTLSNLPAGIYYWSVQAIDNNFAGSAFAPEHSFVVPASFAFSASTYSVNEKGPTLQDKGARITIMRSGSMVGADSVRLTTANGSATAGSDYTTVDEIVSFAPGQESRTITVPVTDDSLIEGSETILLSLSSPSADTSLGSPSSSAITIADDDYATVALSSSSYSVDESGGSAQITIKLTGALASSVSVRFATANGTATAGSDYTSVSQTVSFAAGQTSKTVSIPIADDSTVEASETVSLSLSGPSAGASLASPSSATLTITDNDKAEPAVSTGGKRIGKIASVKLVLGKKKVTTLRLAQAKKVRLAVTFKPKSKLFRYVISIKQGKKWKTLKSVKKTSFSKSKYTTTVKKLFAGKPVKRSAYRLKLYADKNSKALRFKIK